MATRKKNSFISRFKNSLVTLVLASIIFCGLQSLGASSLKFAIISDAHFATVKADTSYKLLSNSAELLDDAIEQVNAIENIDFTMFLGDVIDEAYQKEFSAFLVHAENLNSNWYFTFGNHDTMLDGYLDKNLVINLIKATKKGYNLENSYYSFTPKSGYHAIVLDSIIRDRLTTTGEIDFAQLQWLKNELDNHQDETILIYTHVPVIEPYASESHRLVNSAEVENLLKKYKNPIAIFQGHYHGARILQKENILYISTPSLVSYPNAFRIVTITDFDDRVIFDITLKETNLELLQKKAKLLTFVSAIYYGSESDRNSKITIYKNK